MYKILVKPWHVQVEIVCELRLQEICTLGSRESGKNLTILEADRLNQHQEGDM